MTLKPTYRLLAILFLSVSLIGFTACSDDDDDDPQPSAPQPDFVTPTPSDADGALIAYQTFTDAPVGGFEIIFGGGVAVFFNDGNTSDLIDGGTVELEGTGLDRQDNNSYTYVPDASDPATAATGISFTDNAADWSVSGAGEVPQMTASYAGFPTLGDIEGLETNAQVSLGSAFDLNIADVSGADSVIFAAYSSDGATLLTTLGGGTESHTFTAAEMGTLANGIGLVQVTAYKTTPEVVNGKTFYLINQSVRTRPVEFVD